MATFAGPVVTRSRRPAEPLRDFGRGAGPLPHRHDDVEPREARDELLGVRERPGECRYLGFEAIPIRKSQCYVLIVVENRDLHAVTLADLLSSWPWIVPQRTP
jgi:hypothetical protein